MTPPESSSLYRKYTDPGTVFVYQMGKVGSTSLEHGIPKSAHFHTLYNNYPCQVMFRHYGRRRQGQLLAKNLAKRVLIRRRPETRIICVIREPRARSISMFFQDLNIWMSEYFRDQFHDTRREGMELLLDIYKSHYDHEYHNQWFDREIRRFTGIDVFTAPFDTERGYSLYEKGTFKLMVIRAEDINRHYNAVEAFCGGEISRRNLNSAGNKWYGSVYAEFREHILASPPFPALYERSRFSAHFGYQTGA